MNFEDGNSVEVFDARVELDEVVPAREDFAETSNLDAGAGFENGFLVGFAEAGRSPAESH